MRVLFVSGALPEMECGVGHYTWNLAKALIGQDETIEIGIITSKGVNPSALSPVKNRLRIFPVMESWEVGELPRFVKAARDFQPDIINIETPSSIGHLDRAPCSILIPFLCRMIFTRSKLVVTVHEFSERRRRFKVRILLTALPGHKIITVTEDDFRAIKGIEMSRGKPVYMIPIASNIEPHPFSPEERKRAREEMGIEERELLLVHFGFLLEDKGIENLLVAAKLLLKDGLPVKLLLIGGFGRGEEKERLRIRSILEAFPYKDRVILKGFLPDREVSLLLSVSDIGIFPFLRGASARRGSLLAALVHGLPVITTRGKHTPGLFENRKNIFLIDSSSPAAIKDAVAELSGNQSLRETIGKGGEKILEEFGWSKIASITLKAYG